MVLPGYPSTLHFNIVTGHVKDLSPRDLNMLT